MFSELEHLLYISLQVTLGSSYIQACKSIGFFMYLVYIYIYIYIYGFFPLDRNSNRRLPSLEIQSRHYIYIYAFSRHFYPKRLTVQSGHNFFCQYACSLGIEPTTFCAANAMLYHWDTGTHYNIDSTSVQITFRIPLSKSRSWGVPLCRNVHLGRIWVSPSGTPLPSFGPQNRPKPPHPPYGAPDIYIHIHTQNALHKYWNSKDKIALFAVDSESLKWVVLKRIPSRFTLTSAWNISILLAH